jgi:hypothetical protein
MTNPLEYLPAIRKVHIVHDDTKQQSPPAKKLSEIVATLNTYPLSLGGSPQLILPHAPKRKRAEIAINGSGVVVFGKTLSDCQAAVANAAGEQTGNVFVINGAEFTAAYVTHTTSSLYAALVSANDPVPTVNYPAITQPAVPATGVIQQNLNNAPVTVVINANGATISNVSVNGQSVGTTAGTYIVPAAGTISISYTIATPTWTWTLTPAPVTFNVIPTTIGVLQEIEQ